jgi:TorA maturation chaperone TorD
MQMLLTSQARCLEKGESDDANSIADISTKFLNEHLFKWAIDFFEKVGQSSENSFYREMSRFAIAFTKMEMENIK